MIHGQVLLLNGSTWEPLGIISIPRAVNLLLAGKAVIVEESGRFLRTIRSQFPVPSVIALRHYINVPRRQAPWSRKGVLLRDNHQCIYCGALPGDVVQNRVLSKSSMTVDHITPRSRGGKDTWTNTACACPRCNHRKGDKLPHEAGMKLLWEPKRPRTNYIVLEFGTDNETWKRYIDIGGE
jgi:5-methylcytosine-specific restriction endonuclease McrA